MLSNEAPEKLLDGTAIRAVLQDGELSVARDALGDVSMRPEVAAYIVDLVRSTRSHDSVLTGAGPRATQGLVLASRVRAALDGRDYVTPDDVRGLTKAVLEHRIILRPEYEVEGMTSAEAIDKIVESVATPV